MGWEPEEETPAPVETVAPAASTRAPETPATPPAAPVQPVQEVTPVPSKPFVTETWAPPAARETRVTEAATAVVEDKPKTENEAKPATEKKGGKDSWFSVSSSPWEGEIQKASELASTWDAPAMADPAVAPKNGTEKASEVSPEAKAVIEEASLPSAAVETIREEAALVTENAKFELETEASTQGSSFYAKEEEGVLEPNSAPPAAPNTDDLVARVLARMNPEVLQAVTREILKPVVEAMVKEELKSKKL